MKYLLPTVLAFLFFSCSQQQAQKEKEAEDLVITADKIADEDKSTIEAKSIKKRNYEGINPAIKTTLMTLDSLYDYAPFYFHVEGETYFVVCRGTGEFTATTAFKKGFKYGLVNEKFEEVIKPEYEKIYNLDVSFANCVEVKKDGKVGLINIYDGTKIAPQFDYIIPKNGTTAVAYGLKAGKWYKISQPNGIELVDIAANNVFQALQFDAKNHASTLMYSSYARHHEDDPIEGNGVVITPSYIERLQIMDEFYTDFIADSESQVDFGKSEMRIKTSEPSSISDQVISFFVSFYEEGIDARGYATEKTKLVVVNQADNSLNYKPLVEWGESGEVCNQHLIKFVHNDLIEVITSKKKHYDYEPHYQYFKVALDGTISELISNRRFPYTEFIQIDTSYFTGCFAQSIPKSDPEHDRYNFYLSAHLTIDDLDMMRNEIFASYGYKFKTKKWQQHFAQKSWYTPKYDQVDDQLSDLEKENIEVILKRKNEMEGQEQDFVKKEKFLYVAAG